MSANSGADGNEEPEATRGRRHSAQERNKVLRKYYKENDIFLSAEGILKLISIVGCVGLSALLVWAGGCGRARGLAASAASVALGAAAALALLYAGLASRAPLHAPTAWLYTDLIVSSAAGVLLLASGALSLAVCQLSAVADYIPGPLAMLIAGLVTGSAVVTYSAAMRHWDSVAPRSAPRPAPQTHELEV